MEGLLLTILVVLLIFLLIGLVPIKPELKPYAYLVVVVFIILWLLRGTVL